MSDYEGQSKKTLRENEITAGSRVSEEGTREVKRNRVPRRPACACEEGSLNETEGENHAAVSSTQCRDAVLVRDRRCA